MFEYEATGHLFSFLLGDPANYIYEHAMKQKNVIQFSRLSLISLINVIKDSWKIMMWLLLYTTEFKQTLGEIAVAYFCCFFSWEVY